jgi:hypothetical protein
VCILKIKNKIKNIKSSGKLGSYDQNKKLIFAFMLEKHS